jgi:ATP-dependent Zn protease
LRALNVVDCTELLAGRVAEEVLFPDHCSLGAHHDGIEAAAFARDAVAAEPATSALIDYCAAEARGLIESNRDIVDALVEALIERGTLSGEQVDQIISQGVAARTIEIERRRRDDWKTRQVSATEFLKRLEA